MASVPIARETTPYRLSTGLVVALFVGSAIVAAGVGYLGISGRLGGGIPGTNQGGVPAATPLAKCAGHGALGTFHFSLVARAKGQLSFNASTPGPCFAVAVGSNVTMTLLVAAGANSSDSWVLIPSTGPTDQAPVFPGAGPSDQSRFTGVAPGGMANYTFTVSAAGAYRYVSEVGDHATVGMWGPFNVTSAPVSSAASPALSDVALPHPGPSDGLGTRWIAIHARGA